MEQKNNAGALFKNDKRQTDTQPHYKGSAVIDGVEMWVSAWMKDSKAGTKYMSLSFSPKQSAPSAPATTPTPSQVQPIMNDDDLPF